MIAALVGVVTLGLGLTVLGNNNDTNTTIDDTVSNATDAVSTSIEVMTDVTTTEEDDHSHEEGGDHSHDDKSEIKSETSNSSDIVLSSFNIDGTKFFDGALTEQITIDDCTLASGEVTDCYTISIAGIPSDVGVGDFCPRTTNATDDEVGIWLDGNNLYDIDGEFILDLANIYGDDNWKLYNDDGTVNITETAEAFDAAARPDVDPEYQNHCVEGKIEWLEGGVPIVQEVQIPVNPAKASSTSSGSSLGVTLNGVTIDPSAPVSAILGAYTIAAFDDCGGHINPVAGYHLHAATGCSEYGEAEEGETAMFGYAMDGYAIHSPYVEGEEAADLDECNGHEVSGEYHYHANIAKENAVITCMVGELVEGLTSNGPGGAGGPPGGGQPPQR